jgi:hypothetical protein
MDFRPELAALLRGERIAHLATLRQEAPMASMTLYLAAADFSAFHLHVSRLAWHTQDMLQQPRVALSIGQADDGRADPFTLMLAHRAARRALRRRLRQDPQPVGGAARRMLELLKRE